ncbi:hypothetical protein AALP_AA7G144100 [Arabis alpina]|uniref:Tf2-1-like SH3-like domain-containing protein n=1 Tax=Arabis alpina TaxID=50452 RepID=A0A087GI11_ARAAL|nr:hypothetical protein AALP_AA7G144100 [Arabis alpina]
MLFIMQQQLLKVQQQMKQHVDGHRREVEFTVGDMVFLKIRPYRQKTLARRANEKLATRFYGPYEVEARIGLVAYELKFPPSVKIHHTFHVSQLKAVLGSGLIPIAIPPQLSEEGVLEAEPEYILGTRVNKDSVNDDDEDSQWDYEAVNDFYKGELKWLPNDTLVQSSDKHQQYYEDSDIRENEWLNLYSECAFFTLWENRLTKLKFDVPLEIKKVVVQTLRVWSDREILLQSNLHNASVRSMVQVEKPVDDDVAWSSDDDVDPVLEQKFHRQLRESDGFDLDMGMRGMGMVGLHWHNFQKGLKFQLLELVKYNSCLRGICAYYITMEAMDPADTAHFTFQTCVGPSNNEDNRIITEVCRIKPKPEGSGDDNWHWNEEAIDDFYNGELEWLSDDALTAEVQESDIRENDWLNLYTEFAYHSIGERGLTRIKSDVPLKIKKVVVQTREDVESSKKLKSENAIFYISFSDCGQTEDYRAIVRRTTDGIPGHVCLQVKVRELG